MKDNRDPGVAVAMAAAALAAAFALAQSARPGDSARAPGPGPAGLLAHWPMDEIVSGVVPDASGNGRDAVVKAEGALPALVDGIIGRAMKFAADQRQWLEVAHARQLDAPARITVMAWVKIAARNRAYAVVCNKADRSGNPPWPGWRLRVFWTRAAFQIGTPDGKEFMAASPRWAVMPGRWTHIAGSYDGQKVRVFVNATLAGEADAPGGIAPRGRPLVIGNFVGRKNAYAMDGLIDDVRIYAKALSPEEILAAAAEGLPD